MQLIRIASAVLILSFTIASSQIQWETTHIGRSRGNCQLISNKIKIKIRPFYLDVEEEAEIFADGGVNWGDPATLEISGEVRLSPGTAIRSMLLWNGQTILKAKLKDRSAADSAYEEVVQRDEIRFTPRDPALIEGLGDNRYRFKIYPVAINNSRKIRVLYSIPLQILGGVPKFEIKPFFSAGAIVAPDKIPLEFEQSGSDSLIYIFQNGLKKKQIISGGIYFVPQQDLIASSNPWTFASRSLFVIPDVRNWEKAFSYKAAASDEEKYFTAVFTSLPDTIETAVNSLDEQHHTLEVNINAGENRYIIDVPNSSYFSAYIKSQIAWDKKLNWKLYDAFGKSILSYTQIIEPDTANENAGMLPLIWGSKYSSAEKNGNLGALYGFVDMQMSLLALESDSLSAAQAEEWREQGVPVLTKEEILLPPSLMPRAPDAHVIFDVALFVHFENFLDLLQVNVIGGQLLIHTGNVKGENLSAVLFDIQGRIIHRWDAVPLEAVTTRLQLPHGVRGIVMLRLKIGGRVINKQLVIK